MPATRVAEATQPVILTDTRHKRRRALMTSAALLCFVLFGVARSALSTRLDGFTLDEPYHITAGVSYVREGDYRLNPEHPPLVKLWVGWALRGESFQLPPLRALSDKPDERNFTDEAVFSNNDPDLVQRRVRPGSTRRRAMR